MDLKEKAGSSRDAVLSQAPAWEKTNTVFTNEKAGMEGVDKDKIKKIIYEMSKGSPHFRNEERKQQQTQVKIKRLLKQAATLSAQELAGHRKKVDARISQLLADRDLSRTWIHVDLDAFFASVEELDDPSLKTKPMGVGGIGMLSTANYVARKYGIRSAMPGFIARRLCPELVFVKPDFSKYSKASAKVRVIFREYDEEMDAASLDEAYLDVTDYCKAKEVSGADIAEEMRQRVLTETGLTCSCGVAPNRMLAKVCSDVNKPNGQCVISSDPKEVRQFVDTLAIRKVPGIGKVGEQELKALQVTTCKDLIDKADLLSALYSEIALESFLTAGLGLGRTSHAEPLKDGEVGRKGMGVERTFTPISATHELEAKCCELAAKLAADMEREGLKAKTLTLKLKPPSFELKTRAVTLGKYISTELEIQEAALKLLRAELPIEVRLMGLRTSTFYQAMPSEPGQQSLQAYIKTSSPEAGAAESKEEALGCSRDNDGGSAIYHGDFDAYEAEVEHSAASPEGTWEGNAEDNSRDSSDFDNRRPHPSRSATGQHRKIWTCQLCTFAENPYHHLRCLICDNLKGSAYPSQTFPIQTGKTNQKSGLVKSKGQLNKAGGDVWSSGTSKEVSCSKCGHIVPPEQQREHEDYHIALELSKASKQNETSSENGSSRKRKQSTAAITQFFRPAKS